MKFLLKVNLGPHKIPLANEKCVRSSNMCDAPNQSLLNRFWFLWNDLAPFRKNDIGVKSDWASPSNQYLVALESGSVAWILSSF